MNNSSNCIHISIEEENVLESNLLASTQSLTAATELNISGPLSDEDVVCLGKYLRSHTNISRLSLETVVALTSIDHNAFKHCDTITNIVLPTCINRIGDHAFEQCKALKHLELPDSVTIIGDKAFSGCEELNEINIPEKVSYIGVGAFYGCYKLTDIYVSKTNKRYEYKSGVLFDNVDKTLLRYIHTKHQDGFFTTPEGVVHIGNYAFDGCKGLISVIVNEGCTDLGERSFTRCEDLKTISLPSSINNLTFNAFDECNTLEEIVVDKQNKTYNTRHGVLYSKDMKRLVLCPKSKKSPFFFPSCVETISDGAFSGCKNLKSVILPKNTNRIGAKAFCDCENLEVIDIPNSLKRIDDFAFANCTKLSRIKVFCFTPPVCGVNPFASANTECCMVYVPIDAEMNFRKDYGWDSFNNIEESVRQTLGANFPLFRNLRLKFKKFFISHFS